MFGHTIGKVVTDIQCESGDVLCITDFIVSTLRSFEVYVIHKEYTVFIQHIND